MEGRESNPKMLLRSASEAGKKGDPADGGGVGQAGPPGEACLFPPSRGRDPLVMILEMQQFTHRSQNNGSNMIFLCLILQ